MYKFKFIDGLQPVQGSTALRFGGVWHKMLEIFYKTVKAEGWGAIALATDTAIKAGQVEWEKRSKNHIFYEDYRNFETLQSMLLNYVVEFDIDSQTMEIVATERVFAVVLNPECVFVGKIDLTVLLGGMLWIVEFKTTGFRLDAVINQLKRSAQVIGYNYAEKCRNGGNSATGSLVTFAFASSRKTKDGSYGKLNIEFRRSPQIYTEEDMEYWKEAFVASAEEMRLAIETNEFPRYGLFNDTCYPYGNNCVYTRLCEQNKQKDEDLNLEEYIIEPWDVEKEDLSFLRL
jgi:hypothetical protein